MVEGATEFSLSPPVRTRAVESSLESVATRATAAGVIALSSFCPRAAVVLNLGPRDDARDSDDEKPGDAGYRAFDRAFVVEKRGRRNAPARTDRCERAGARSPVPERVCLSPSPVHPFRLSRSRSDYHPNHAIPRGTAIITFPARSADWLVQSQPRSGEERRGVPTRSVLLALAPSAGEEPGRERWSGKV